MKRIHGAITKLGFWLFASSLIASCSNSKPSTGSDAGLDGDVCSQASSTFSITDDTNYSLSNTLSVQLSTLKDATDLTFDWSGITKDFFGKAVDPINDLDLVLISFWHLTPAEIEVGLKNDNLPYDANQGAISTYPEGSFTSQHLLGFDMLGNPMPEEEIWKRFDTSNPDFQYPQDQFTFMLMASTGTVPGKDARMLSMFTIDPNAEQTSLDMTNDSTVLDYDVNLAKAKPVPVPSGVSSLTISWKSMTTNALGNKYEGSQITEAAVAHFATQSTSDLEDQFLNLEDIAEGWWSGEVVRGTSIDLGTLMAADGTAFPGVDSTGTWVVALFCTEYCNSPAPWSITFLKSCD